MDVDLGLLWADESSSSSSGCKPWQIDACTRQGKVAEWDGMSCYCTCSAADIQRCSQDHGIYDYDKCRCTACTAYDVQACEAMGRVAVEKGNDCVCDCPPVDCGTQWQDPETCLCKGCTSYQIDNCATQGRAADWDDAEDKCKCGNCLDSRVQQCANEGKAINPATCTCMNCTPEQKKACTDNGQTINPDTCKCEGCTP